MYSSAPRRDLGSLATLPAHPEPLVGAEGIWGRTIQAAGSGGEGRADLARVWSEQTPPHANLTRVGFERTRHRLALTGVGLNPTRVRPELTPVGLNLTHVYLDPTGVGLDLTRVCVDLTRSHSDPTRLPFERGRLGVAWGRSG